RAVGRREFLRLTAGAAVAGTLAGCGASARDAAPAPKLAQGTPGDPVRQPLFSANPAIDDGLEPERGPLHVLNWPGYLWRKVLDDFGREYGVDWELTSFADLAQATRRLDSKGPGFDVFVPTQQVLPAYVATRLLQPLNLSYLPNLRRNVWPLLADPFYDRGPRYSVPYTVYQTGLGWRVDTVAEDVARLANPWDALWDRSHRGRLGVYDDYREALVAGLLHEGVRDVNTGEPRQLDRAREGLSQLNRLGVRYTLDGAYAKLPRGALELVQAWSGDMISAPYYLPADQDPGVLRYVWPPRARGARAGGLITGDCLTVPANARNPVLAHHFLDFMLDTAHATDNFSWLGYQSPLTALDTDRLVLDGLVPRTLSSAIVQPGDFRRGQVPLALPPQAETRWLRAWQAVRRSG
ncbi:MAG: spermidine/putrescine ABC transporter substrate-binding protein, partial [Actinomycetota bacterium]|nr:spermidine/putrescine ABC transporter substrate-binding protein [Actinomycetota bacterium]